VRLPATYGTFHDETGASLPKCVVFFGPFKKTGKRVEMTRVQRRYFGSDHPAFLAEIPKLKGITGWKVVGKVRQIFYFRRGRIARAGFHHPFASGHEPTLSKTSSLYKLSLGSGCLVDSRGYVFP
jgi:hypothetical protein